MCEPCGQVALLYAAWVSELEAQATAQAEEEEWIAYQMDTAISPDLDEFDLRTRILVNRSLVALSLVLCGSLERKLYKQCKNWRCPS